MNETPTAEQTKHTLDVRNALSALRPAAQRARDRAAQTGHAVVIFRDGKTIRESLQERMRLRRN
jgi:hypothetical protein